MATSKTVGHLETRERPTAALLNWQKVATQGSGPCARGGHSSCLVGNVVLCWGGHFYAGDGKFEYLEDLFALDLESFEWLQPKTTGTKPSARYGHSCVLIGERMYIFGGKSKIGYLNDIWYLDTSVWQWIKVSPSTPGPCERTDQGCLCVGNKIVIHGGWDGTQLFDDFWVFDTETATWIRPIVEGTIPAKRRGHSLNITPDGRIVLFGGAGEEKGGLPKYLADVYELDVETMVWEMGRVSGLRPHGRCSHTSVLVGGQLVVIGGWSGIRRCKVCNASINPEGRTMHQKECVVGKSQPATKPSTVKTSDFFVTFDYEKLKWSKPEFSGAGVGFRFGHSTTRIENHIMVIGGWDSQRPLKDVWLLDLAGVEA